MKPIDIIFGIARPVDVVFSSLTPIDFCVSGLPIKKNTALSAGIALGSRNVSLAETIGITIGGRLVLAHKTGLLSEKRISVPAGLSMSGRVILATQDDLYCRPNAMALGSAVSITGVRWRTLSEIESMASPSTLNALDTYSLGQLDYTTF